MNQDLLRQRRNLIAISAVLLVFDFAQVTIAKISVLGTGLLIGKPKIVMVCSWLLWAYFFLRYYQYWRAEADQNIRGSFKKRLDAYARSHTKATAVQDDIGQFFNDYKISRSGLASWSYTLEVDPVDVEIALRRDAEIEAGVVKPISHAEFRRRTSRSG